MSLPKKLTVRELPETIKKFILMLNKPDKAEIYECRNMEDLCAVADKYPLELISTPIKVLDIITGYFMVGVCSPCAADTFKEPVLAFYRINSADWRDNSDNIKKEVGLRKQKLTQERPLWKK